jgi:bifunctional non-homologous end joining protein LigD
MIRFGISGLPAEDGDDGAFLDALVERGHGAYELSFVHGFPWKVRRCEAFGELAGARGIALSVHAPYFAILTVEDPDKRKQTLAGLEHTMKLGKALGAHTIVAHTGHVGGRDPDELHELVADGLSTIEPKVRDLGVALGLETSGTERAFGSLGDIALIAKEFAFVRPVIDWAHVHAKSGGGLTTTEAFTSVIEFLRSEFPAWALDPLHTQFTDNQFGPSGEIRHIPYGEGSLRAEPLAEAAIRAGLRMIVISEAKEESSHDAIQEALIEGEEYPAPADHDGGEPVASGLVHFPDQVLAVAEGDGALVTNLERTIALTNVDKVLFGDDGYTKGDLVTYYASVAPLLLPHLENRALSMSRYPNGISEDSFYEKRRPGHTPDWVVSVPVSSSRSEEPLDYITAADTETLVWLANMACIEMHPWLSRANSPANPDFAVFDLDPQEGASWDQVVYVAGLVNVLLERLGLAGYPKTSGARGIHVFVPLDPDYPYRRVRRFVEAVGRLIVSADPEAATMEWDTARRGPRIFIDHNQNVAGKTQASVYSVRPRAGATVSTPVLWQELDEVKPEDFTIGTIWERLRQRGDLFAPVLTGGQALEGAEGALGLTDDG